MNTVKSSPDCTVSKCRNWKIRTFMCVYLFINCQCCQNERAEPRNIFWESLYISQDLLLVKILDVQNFGE